MHDIITYTNENWFRLHAKTNSGPGSLLQYENEAMPDAISMSVVLLSSVYMLLPTIVCVFEYNTRACMSHSLRRAVGIDRG